MNPSDIGRFRTVTDPQLHPDGTTVAFVVSRMDLDNDCYERSIWLWNGSEARAFTAGPGDSRPRWSPDGATLAFLRTDQDGDTKRAQLHVIPTGGGEPTRLTSFDLGVSEAEWSPDGSRLAMIAKTWTGEWAELDDDERARRPARVTRAGWRWDDDTWRHDRRSHVYVVPADGGAEPVLVTPGDWNERGVAWRPDGQRLAFVSARHERRGLEPGTQVWEVEPDGGEPVPLVDQGGWDWVGYRPDGAPHVYGLPDVWAYPAVGVLFRVEPDDSLVDLTGKLDRDPMPGTPPVSPAGPQWLDDGSFLTVLEDAGRLRVVRIDPDGVAADVIGGDRAVTGIAAQPSGEAFAFTATDPTDPGELRWWEAGEEQVLTDLNAEFRAGVSLVAPHAFRFERDGATVDGWIYLPAGSGRVPLLLNIHGGPASQYGYAFFDEFQVYARAGYGVVACNPRGSSGRGQEHMHAVVGRWHEDEPPDLRDLLGCVAAAADAHPRLDRERRGVMGGSYGGFATIRLTALDQGFAAAIVERAVVSFSSFAGTADIGPWFGAMFLGSRYHEDPDLYHRASPLSHAHRITTPTLILHSERDYRCPIEQAEQLYTLLQMVGTPSELVRVPAESHELSRSGKPRHRLERFEIILEWLDRHLGAA